MNSVTYGMCEVSGVWPIWHPNRRGQALFMRLFPTHLQPKKVVTAALTSHFQTEWLLSVQYDQTVTYKPLLENGPSVMIPFFPVSRPSSFAMILLTFLDSPT